MTHTLVAAIQSFVEYSTIELAERVASCFEPHSKWEDIRKFPHVPSTKLNAILSEIVQAGLKGGQSPAETAFALRAACAVEARHRSTPGLELVLSGPSFPPFEMRRTDEAILQIVQNPRERLTIVSFILYRIDRLAQALDEASHRGVEIRMFVKSEKLFDREMSGFYDGTLKSGMQVYVWAESQRLHAPHGRHGVLHAKATIADSSALFISSANLTEYAMSLNIELGVLIRGGDYPRKIEQLFDNYLAHGLFVKPPRKV